MEKSHQKLVSICIPTYNGVLFIERTIASALNQSYPNIEIIVCDDGSTDDTVSKAESFNDDRNEVIFIRKNLLKTGIINPRKAISRSITLDTNIIGESMTRLFRKELFNIGCRYNGANSCLIDFDFWIKLLQKGKLFVVPEHLASFRISSNSISSSLQLKQYSSFIKSQTRNYFVDNLCDGKN